MSAAAVANARSQTPFPTSVSSMTPKKAGFHFSFGQLLGTLLLGLESASVAYENPTAFFENPTQLAQIISGFSQVIVPQSAPPDATPLPSTLPAAQGAATT